MQRLFTTTSAEQTTELGRLVGQQLRGGEVIELISDLGGGKTTLVRGLAAGFGSRDPVASPSFAISLVYNNPIGQSLHHFDLYRLSELGIISHDIQELVGDPTRVVVFEWADLAKPILPNKRLTIKLSGIDLTGRQIRVRAPNDLAHLLSFEWDEA